MVEETDLSRANRLRNLPRYIRHNEMHRLVRFGYYVELNNFEGIFDNDIVSTGSKVCTDPDKTRRNRESFELEESPFIR